MVTAVECQVHVSIVVLVRHCELYYWHCGTWDELHLLHHTIYILHYWTLCTRVLCYWSNFIMTLESNSESTNKSISEC